MRGLIIMSLKDKQILIVDNDDLTLKMLHMIFKSTGARILLEQDCQGASRVLDQIKPDIIILNLHENDMKDSEYCKQMKEKFSKVVTPIIVTSTMTVFQYKERASSLGAIRYFQKPYSPSNLLNTACEILEIPMMPNQVRTFNLRA